MYSAIKYAISISVLFTMSSIVFATPITFNFTGTISDHILSSGQLQKTWSGIPKWNGKTVSGSLIMDLDGVVPLHQHSEQSYYQTTAHNDNLEQWMKFIINNPDGSSYTIPASIDPLPIVQSNFSTASLAHSPGYDYSFFYAGRTFINRAPKIPPRQMMSLRLGSIENSHQLLSSVDFNTVEFHPEFATNENYGLVTYVKENGKKMDYAFRIDSLTRAIVPEPGTIGLILLGFVGLLLNRAQRIK